MPGGCSPPALPAALLDYLEELPLAACIFTHDALAQPTLAPPAYHNPACRALLAQGHQEPRQPSGFTAPADHVNGDEAHCGGADDEAGDPLTECVSAGVREELASWLREGASSSSSAPSGRSGAAERPRPPPRHFSLKLHDHISWPPVAFGAVVHIPSSSPSSSSGESEVGYTVLTQLPPSELARGALSPTPPPTSTFNPSTTSPNPAPNARPVERIGELELDAERAKDATTLEGMCWTLWQAPIAVFRVNREFSIVQTNPKWRETTAIPTTDSNDAWASRIHPDDRDRVTAHYGKMVEDLAAGRPMPTRDEFEFRWIPREDGQDQWCSAVIEPCMVQGRIEGYVCYMLNINKHKALESASEQRERILRNELALLSETCQVGLSRHELDGTFISVNKAWHDICKVPENAALSEWENNLHPDDRDRVLSTWRDTIARREPLTAQFRWKHGEVCLVQVQPNSMDKEKVTGWIGSVTNITLQARAEEAVLNLSKEREARAKQEAKEAEERRKVAVEEKRQQELLIDVTSHEIRNPISAILQNSDFTRSSLQSLRRTLYELKERSALPAELDGKLLHDLDEDIEALDSITECGLAQERIANDILGLAQIQLSKYSITPVEFDLATSLRNICRMFKSECRSKGIELKLVIGSSLARLGPRARVFADPARLTQVLVNLLSNAIRFTAKSAVRQVTLSVEVSSLPPDRDAPLIPPEEVEYHIESKRPIYLFFSVEDTGPGMTEEETGRLFAKFMQGSPFTHTAWGGSGLGLWIARNLCELQAGRIEVASQVGKGSIFRCFITARSVDSGPSDKSDEILPVIEGITGPNAHRGAAPKVYLAKPGEEEKPLSGLRVLCCEDNDINRTVLKRQLVKEGAEILLASDGQEGLEVLNAHEPGHIDCILMDIEMPILDGVGATRQIRTAEEQGQRPGHQRIVGLTGNARQAQKQVALDAGMDAVVTKPYKIPDLVEKITGHVEASTAPPSPTLHPSFIADDSPEERMPHLAPTSRTSSEVAIDTSAETTVLSITGDEKLETAKEGEEASTVRSSIDRVGPGKTLPASHDPMEALEKQPRQNSGEENEPGRKEKEGDDGRTGKDGNLGQREGGDEEAEGHDGREEEGAGGRKHSEIARTDVADGNGGKRGKAGGEKQ
ncbi:hypothetical protein JCM8097_000943 [Rhodosporidiobolus ruineniae]